MEARLPGRVPDILRDLGARGLIDQSHYTGQPLWYTAAGRARFIPGHPHNTVTAILLDKCIHNSLASLVHAHDDSPCAGQVQSFQF